jgi:histidinol-phosphatase (PHP family)
VSDYHLHLHPHAGRAGGPPPGEYPAGYIDRYFEVAASGGVTELGFTEHLYRCVESEAVFGNWWESDASIPAHVMSEMDGVIRAERNLSLERYVAVVLDAKARGLPVKLGLEVDFYPGTERAVIDLLAPYPWDFLIGSVHWIGGWDFTLTGGPSSSGAASRRRGATTSRSRRSWPGPGWSTCSHTRT